MSGEEDDEEEDCDYEEEEKESNVEDNFQRGINAEDDNYTPAIEIDVKSAGFLSLRRGLIDIINGYPVLSTMVRKLCDLYNNNNAEPIRKRLHLDVDCQWNLMYLMISTFLKYRPILIKLFEAKYHFQITKKQLEMWTSYELTVNDWAVAESLLHVIKPFCSATKLISGSTYLTNGRADYVIRNIQTRFLENNTTDDPLVQNMKKCLLQTLKRYTVFDIEQYKLLIVRFHMFVISISKLI